MRASGLVIAASGGVAFPLISLCTMGKQDRGQPKLAFPKARPQCSASVEAPVDRAELIAGGEDAASLDVRSLLVEVRSSLRSIDSKIDSIMHRLWGIGWINTKTG